MNGRNARRSLVGIAVVGLTLIGFGLTQGPSDPSGPRELKLKNALVGVDRIRVRSGGTCHRDEMQEVLLVEETDLAKVNDVIRALRIHEADEVFQCGCCGDPSFEFYRGEELAATLGYHHGRMVRWPEGWPGDVYLTAESAASLKAWLKGHGAYSKLGDW
jgi:hypothetical protein